MAIRGFNLSTSWILGFKPHQELNSHLTSAHLGSPGALQSMYQVKENLAYGLREQEHLTQAINLTDLFKLLH